MRRWKRTPAPSGSGAAPASGAEAAAPDPSGIPDRYVLEAPHPQLAIDLFPGEWATLFPSELGVTAGPIPLLWDPRIERILEVVGDVAGAEVLELGPLDGGHTHMLERAGAHVTAIEAKTHAYLRCLVLKELLAMRESRFLLGDFLPYLETTDRRFHLVVASGVLYHATDPLRLLAAIARVTDRIGLWTHYYDAAVTGPDSPHFAEFAGTPVTARLGSTEVVLHPRSYRGAQRLTGFCGGAEPTVAWMELPGLLAVLRELGFTQIDADEPDLGHVNGPNVLVVARR